MSEPPQPGKALERRHNLTDLVPAAPGLLRLATSSARRMFQWSVTTSLDMTTGTIKALAEGQNPITVAQHNLSTLRGLAREALGIPADTNGTAGHKPLTAAELRARGAQLLQQSSDVNYDEDLHPAYERILGDIAPDESRILRLLATEGPQPAVDIRTGRPLGIGSEMVASGLSMIGINAGVRRPDRTKAYLNNLYRLGLIWFSHEPLSDPKRYQVLEVQPDVAAAIKRAGRGAKTIRRSILLTPFGEDFVEVVLPVANARPLGRTRVVDVSETSPASSNRTVDTPPGPGL